MNVGAGAALAGVVAAAAGSIAAWCAADKSYAAAKTMKDIELVRLHAELAPTMPDETCWSTSDSGGRKVAALAYSNTNARRYTTWAVMEYPERGEVSAYAMGDREIVGPGRSRLFKTAKICNLDQGNDAALKFTAELADGECPCGDEARHRWTRSITIPVDYLVGIADQEDADRRDPRRLVPMVLAEIERGPRPSRSLTRLRLSGYVRGISTPQPQCWEVTPVPSTR